MSYLVDTNVLSEARKSRRCDPGVASWFSAVPATEIYVSALTAGEIRKGVEARRRRDELAARALERWLEELMTTYADRILPVDEEVADRWGRLNVPDPLPPIDGLLAATQRPRPDAGHPQRPARRADGREAPEPIQRLSASTPTTFGEA